MKNFLIGLVFFLIVMIIIIWQQMKEIEKIAYERGKEIQKMQQVLYDSGLSVY